MIFFWKELIKIKKNVMMDGRKLLLRMYDLELWFFVFNGVLVNAFLVLEKAM